MTCADTRKQDSLMRRLLLLLCLTVSAFGQSESFNHVHWTMTIVPSTAAAGATVLARISEAELTALLHGYGSEPK